MNQIIYQPIGLVHSPFKKPEGTPIQSSASKDSLGTIEIFPEYVEGLKDLNGFSHIILIYHFHLVGKPSLLVKPFLDEKLHGVFATRAPGRPNPLGISIVRLIHIENNIIHIQELDILDGTPVLDIKPYVPEFDIKTVEKIGWLVNKIQKLHTIRDDGRFTK